MRYAANKSDGDERREYAHTIREKPTLGWSGWSSGCVHAARQDNQMLARAWGAWTLDFELELPQRRTAIRILLARSAGLRPFMARVLQCATVTIVPV